MFKLYNTLTNRVEEFQPLEPTVVRMYVCGPTVYNYQHIGNMRAYVFADTLGRTLSFKGYSLKHVINITDVGHLTSDADAGDDKISGGPGNDGIDAKSGNSLRGEGGRQPVADRAHDPLNSRVGG